MLHDLAKQIRDKMEDASRAQAFQAYTAPGFTEPTAYIPTPAARSLVTCLKTAQLPALFGADGKLRRTPAGNLSASTVRMDAAVIAASRVAAAGAQVIVRADSGTAHATGPNGVVVMERVPVSLRTIEPAPFGTVDVDVEGEAPVVSFPVNSADIDWQQATTKGVRFEMPRSYIRQIDRDQLCVEIITSLTLGLARAADEVLLSAIKEVATTGVNNFIPLAAEQRLLFSELRGLVGTTGTGANIDAAGSLRALGLPAELTGDMSETIVGAWNRVGVTIKDDVSIHFERIDKAGGLAVTCWAAMIPLVPDASKFWVAA